jgi:hypothetical protein
VVLRTTLYYLARHLLDIVRIHLGGLPHAGIICNEPRVQTKQEVVGGAQGRVAVVVRGALCVGVDVRTRAHFCARICGVCLSQRQPTCPAHPWITLITGKSAVLRNILCIGTRATHLGGSEQHRYAALEVALSILQLCCVHTGWSGIVHSTTYPALPGRRLLNDILGMGILISNTFGLFLVICLLSIGLVRVPRHLWRLSRRHVMLKVRRRQADRQETDARMTRTRKAA